MRWGGIKLAKYLIGIDAGTSVTKSVLFSLDGEEVLTRQKRTRPLKPGPGLTEHDLYEVWASVEETLIQLLQDSAIAPEEIQAVGITAQGDGTWLLGEDGEPVCPAISWLDSRSGSSVRKWERSGVAEQVFSYTGTTLSTSLQSGQLHWLGQNRPDLLEKTQAVCHAKDWIFYKLTGEISIDTSETMHTFYDRRRGAMCDEVFRLLEIQEWESRLPRVLQAIDSVAPIRSELAVRFGLNKDTPVVRGPFDVAASAIGVGALTEGDVVSIVGSSSIHNQTIGSAAFPTEYCGHTIDMGVPNRSMRMFGSMSGTLNLDWAVENLFSELRADGAVDFGKIEEAISEIQPASEGLIYLPFIDSAGERSPFIKPTARAVFFGLHSQHTKAHMMRAVYEGVALSARDNYERMPFAFNTVRAAGGGSRSRYWMQIWANVTGKRIQIMEGKECGARGAAIVAGVATGVFSSFEAAVDSMVHAGGLINPDPAETAVYDDLYELYVGLYKSLWDTWDRAYVKRRIGG